MEDHVIGVGGAFMTMMCARDIGDPISVIGFLGGLLVMWACNASLEHQKKRGRWQ